MERKGKERLAKEIRLRSIEKEMMRRNKESDALMGEKGRNRNNIQKGKKGRKRKRKSLSHFVDGD